MGRFFHQDRNYLAVANRMDSSLDDIITRRGGGNRGTDKKWTSSNNNSYNDSKKDVRPPPKYIDNKTSNADKYDKLNTTLDDLIRVGKIDKRPRRDDYRGRDFGRERDFGERERSRGPRDAGFDRPKTSTRSQPYPPPERWDYNDRRGGGRSAPRPREGTFNSRILVQNIPKDLDARDLEEAFLEVGRVHHVEMDGSRAWVVFSSSREALEAEHRYDGGQINKQTIRVSIA